MLRGRRCAFSVNTAFAIEAAVVLAVELGAVRHRLVISEVVQLVHALWSSVPNNRNG